MSFNLQIPKELSHLKVDHRGYPIPYFVSWIDGKPEFRFIKPERLEMIIEKKLCHICGKKLPTDYFYFIAGPIGLQNRVSTDAAMHRICAEFSLNACPHLYLQKSERRDNDERGKIAVANDSGAIIRDKPAELFLVKCNKFKVIYEGGHRYDMKKDPDANGMYIAPPHESKGRMYIRYRPVSSEKYLYVDGKLAKAE